MAIHKKTHTKKTKEEIGSIASLVGRDVMTEMSYDTDQMIAENKAQIKIKDITNTYINRLLPTWKPKNKDRMTNYCAIPGFIIFVCMCVCFCVCVWFL